MQTTLSGHHVLMRAGTLRLLLPQASVGAAEYRESEPNPTAHPRIFEMPAGEGLRNVIFPSSRLRALDRVDSPRFVLTQLRVTGADDLWFAWDEVRVFINAAFEAHDLPPALLGSEELPATRYCELDDELVLCADASAVVAYLFAGLEVTE
ncbi:hypothetical protein [Ramlibacter sp.]|uniref:hypothetical protein n=1 Tax=Ramlibacter sp. TaxID=1917967 RepID=UPI003D0EA594